jgi:hypothetical protein
MTDQPLDRWRDRMVAALYGELDEEEMRQLSEELERNAELAAEWRELNEARAMLARLSDAEPAGEFRFDPQPEVSRGSGSVVPFPRWRWAMASAAGFAAAATLFLALIVAGLRIDHTSAGLLVRFGGGADQPGAVGLEGGGSGRAVTGFDQEQYLTRAEFAAVAEMMMQATTTRLDELERRQSSSHMEATWALYDALASNQQRRFDELSAQIQLAAYQTGGGGYGRPITGQPNTESQIKEKTHDYE